MTALVAVPVANGALYRHLGWPGEQVGIDGCWEVYGELLPELRKAYSDPEAFDRLVKARDIRAVVLARNTAETRQMVSWLSRRKDWVLRNRGMQAFLFERSQARGGRR